MHSFYQISTTCISPYLEFTTLWAKPFGAFGSLVFTSHTRSATNHALSVVTATACVYYLKDLILENKKKIFSVTIELVMMNIQIICLQL